MPYKNQVDRNAACQRHIDRERQAERKAAYNKEWRRSSNGRVLSLLKACRASAKSRGHECVISKQDVEELLEPMVCSITGVPLFWHWEGVGFANPWAPSLDRIDNSRGYARDNLRLVCWAFNKARGDWDDETFDRLARAYVAAH